jgi:hypothetical protein
VAPVIGNGLARGSWDVTTGRRAAGDQPLDLGHNGGPRTAAPQPGRGGDRFHVPGAQRPSPGDQLAPDDGGVAGQLAVHGGEHVQATQGVRPVLVVEATGERLVEQPAHRDEGGGGQVGGRCGAQPDVGSGHRPSQAQPAR